MWLEKSFSTPESQTQDNYPSMTYFCRHLVVGNACYQCYIWRARYQSIRTVRQRWEFPSHISKYLQEFLLEELWQILSKPLNQHIPLTISPCYSHLIIHSVHILNSTPSSILSSEATTFISLQHKVILPFLNLFSPLTW